MVDALFRGGQVGVRAVGWFVSGGILWWVWKALQSKGSGGKSLVGSAIFLNTGSLIYLSLVWPAEDWNWIGFWTFVMEPRYFVPSMMMILWVCWASIWDTTTFRFQKWAKWLVLLLLLSIFTYPLYIKWKVYSGDHETVVEELKLWEDLAKEWEGKVQIVVTTEEIPMMAVYGMVNVSREDWGKRRQTDMLEGVVLWVTDKEEPLFPYLTDFHQAGGWRERL